MLAAAAVRPAEPGFWRLAEEDPDRPAVVLPDGAQVRAGSLLAAANRLVHALRARGLAPGDTVAVALGDGLALLEVYFAAMQAGWYFAPLPVRLTPPELEHVLRDAAPKALVVDRRTAAAATRAIAAAGFPGERCWVADAGAGAAVGGADDPAASAFPPLQALVARWPASAPPDRRFGERLFYTSGTTGRPRAVERPLSGESPEASGALAADHLRAMAGILPRSGGVHLVASPLYHSASLLWCTDHLHMGHAVVLTDGWSAEGTLERIDRHRVTGAFLVPTHFHRLLALPEAVRRRFDGRTLRHVIHGGAPCPIEVKRRMLAWWGPVIYEVYGAAEGGGVGIGPDEWLAHPGSVGRGGDSVRVLRDDGSPCAPGEVGAVYLRLRRPFVYRGDPAKTAAQRRGDLFTAGDLGHLDADGYLHLRDRAADVIICGGVNIYPAEVEAVLVGHPRVADAAVFGVPDDEWGERVHAAIELAPGLDGGPAPEPDDLVRHCRERLAPFKCPRSIDIVERVPRDPNGKLYRRRLRDPHWAGRGSGASGSGDGCGSADRSGRDRGGESRP